MINIGIKDYTITIKGHANYAPIGQDIVCASVSAVFYFILYQAMRDNIIDKYDINEGNSFVVLRDSTQSKLIIDTLKDYAHDLMEQYPKNVKVTYD